jgi:Uma2 family endonuclease
MSRVLRGVNSLYDPLIDGERDRRYEWVDGQYREKPSMGAAANHALTILLCRMQEYAGHHQAGLVFSARCAYQIFGDDPRKVRKPDASFVARGRLPDDRPPPGRVVIPPDLIVEIIPPDGDAEEIDRRVADYLGAGVKLIWILYPATRSVWVVRRDGSAARLTEDKDLSGEDVVPGFACPVRALFADI